MPLVRVVDPQYLSEFFTGPSPPPSLSLTNNRLGFWPFNTSEGSVRTAAAPGDGVGNLYTNLLVKVNMLTVNSTIYLIKTTFKSI